MAQFSYNHLLDNCWRKCLAQHVDKTQGDCQIQETATAETAEVGKYWMPASAKPSINEMATLVAS